MPEYWVVVEIDNTISYTPIPKRVHGFFDIKLNAEYFGEQNFKDDYEVVPFTMLCQ